jgi:hypothetical protein
MALLSNPSVIWIVSYLLEGFSFEAKVLASIAITPSPKATLKTVPFKEFGVNTKSERRTNA